MAIVNAVSALRDMPSGEKIDTVVLACTHFPLLSDELQSAFGPDVRLVDGAAGIARRIVSLTENQEFDANAVNRFVCTGKTDIPEHLISLLSSHGLTQIEHF